MMQVEGHYYPLIIYAGSSILWIVFFMIGIWYSCNESKNTIALGLVLIILGLIGSIVEILYYFPLHGGGLGIKLSSFIFSAGVILLLFSKKPRVLFRQNKLINTICFIGDISFGIYLVHMYVRVGLNRYFQSGNWIIDWLLTLGVTILVVCCIKCFLPEKFASKYLGLR